MSSPSSALTPSLRGKALCGWAWVSPSTQLLSGLQLDTPARPALAPHSPVLRSPRRAEEGPSGRRGSAHEGDLDGHDSLPWLPEWLVHCFEEAALADSPSRGAAAALAPARSAATREVAEGPEAGL